ncbi:MAG TPA: hypothetical protein VFM64_04560 [Candidatus Nitrosotenuis sp.]|nr:hypothetical protein [Candidatus Nitrosotenuis sp.]
MDSSEKIVAHLLSVWKEEKKLFSRGKECMFFLTNKHLIFVSQTEATLKWWRPAVQRQIMALTKSDNLMITHDGYDEKDLLADLENKKNEEHLLQDVISVDTEEKVWGTVLKLQIRDKEKEKKLHLSIVKDWVSYPVKDPVKFMKVDWAPIVEYIKNNQGR